MPETINTNILTHEVGIGPAKILVVDDISHNQAGFSRMVEDVVGETTGSNELAVIEGERARETHEVRTDLILAKASRDQRQQRDRPLFQIFRHNNERDVIMVTCHWDADKECQIASVAHCWEDLSTEWGWDFTILKRAEIRI